MSAITNSEAVRAKCKLICNTCYVDEDVLKVTLSDAGLNATDVATPNDPAIVECAILIVKGWVETSRSESGISASIDKERLEQNILFWCNRAGLDASEFLEGIVTTVENGSDLW